MIPASSGFCLGSTNWVINSAHEKIVYLSGSSTLTTHPRPMYHHALKNADVLIMTDLTQVPVSNPDSVLGMLCMVVCKIFYCELKSSQLIKNKFQLIHWEAVVMCWFLAIQLVWFTIYLSVCRLECKIVVLRIFQCFSCHQWLICR